MGFFRKKDPDMEYDLRKLEIQLMATLQPVSPRPEFVHGLRTRLAAKEIGIGSRILSKKISNNLLVAGGVVGSVIMIATSIKGLISLISVIGFIVRFITRESQRHQTSPA